MLIRYDFGDKLDLSRFEKQVPQYIGTMREITYHIVLPHYMVNVEIVGVDDSPSHMSTIWLSEVWRDEDGEIKDTKIIVPYLDSRFKEIDFIKDKFQIDNYKAYIYSNSVQATTNMLCRIVKLVHKINGLTAFL